MSLLELVFTFFYIGLFTIGGGVVAITLMQQALVTPGIISQDQFYNMVAISESTPGPLGTNMATYIGYNLYGIPGGILATLAEVLPSIIIITIIAHFLKKFKDNLLVKNTMAFLRPVTTGLILVPAVQIFVFTIMNIPQNYKDIFSLAGIKGIFDWYNLLAYAVFTFLLFKFKKMHPIFIIILGAIFGIIFL